MHPAPSRTAPCTLTNSAGSPGCPLRIAGPISNPDYYAETIAPRLGPDVTHVGHLSHARLATLVGGARAALCTPRWDEPYGLVVAEALACGTPVVAVRRGGIPDILDEHCGILVEPDDGAALGRAIGRAIHLDRASCRRRAETTCDAERMVDAYEVIYADMVAATLTVASPSATQTVREEPALLSVA